ncbi:MAG: protein translocase subunit SecD [Parcubacteria group bacterium]|nr:protein translocase subunit SecD [Parcubacteria group bacterium]
MDRKKTLLLLSLIFVLTAAAAVFVYPKWLGGKYLPWRLGLDLVGGAHLIYEIDMANVNSAERDSVANGLRDVIEKRVNLFGVSEPLVEVARSSDSYRLIVELAGIKDVATAVNQIGLTPFLDFREVEIGDDGQPKNFTATPLSGRYISGARLDFDQTTFAPRVALQFNDEGAKIFEELTAKNVGKPIAVFLDNALMEMPTVREKISGGKAQITGQFTLEEAKKLVERFNAGALPAPINLVSQQVVGASLGQDSLNKAIYGGAVGTALVAIFMIIYYRGFGFVSVLALFSYIALTLGVMKLLGITLTLAGIAGFILSIGMAVDANILIFERAKEELRRGLMKKSAIEEGFKRAWSSIRDSNIATVISSVILYYLTSSFVKGFALTLLIGVLISMFSAITISRSLLRAFAGNK